MAASSDEVVAASSDEIVEASSDEVVQASVDEVAEASSDEIVKASSEEQEQQLPDYSYYWRHCPNPEASSDEEDTESLKEYKKGHNARRRQVARSLGYDVPSSSEEEEQAQGAQLTGQPSQSPSKVPESAESIAPEQVHPTLPPPVMHKQLPLLLGPSPMMPQTPGTKGKEQMGEAGAAAESSKGSAESDKETPPALIPKNVLASAESVVSGVAAEVGMHLQSAMAMKSAAPSLATSAESAAAGVQQSSSDANAIPARLDEIVEWLQVLEQRNAEILDVLRALRPR